MIGDENRRTGLGDLQMHWRKPVIVTAKEPNEAVQPIQPASAPIHGIRRAAASAKHEEQKTASSRQ